MSEQAKTETTVEDEIAAMEKIAHAMRDLDNAQRGRVVRWACDRYADFSRTPTGTGGQE
ncbi:MAG: hypothetical protein R3268_08920 [Acidiferrobacterales bacterium]|nr:hypothetical protein [Acidiferrobacterales bacterium]